jgi:hypothetical protein
MIINRVSPIDPKNVDRGSEIRTTQCEDSLRMSRSFGDFYFKQNPGITWEQQAVTACPELRFISRAERPTLAFVVLACDGVWDVLRDDEVVQFVAEKLGFVVHGICTMPVGGITTSMAARTCDDLLAHCLSRGSQDNLTAMIIIIPPLSAGTTTTVTATANTTSGSSTTHSRRASRTPSPRPGYDSGYPSSLRTSPRPRNSFISDPALLEIDITQSGSHTSASRSHSINSNSVTNTNNNTIDTMGQRPTLNTLLFQHIEEPSIIDNNNHHNNNSYNNNNNILSSSLVASDSVTSLPYPHTVKKPTAINTTTNNNHNNHTNPNMSSISSHSIYDTITENTTDTANNSITNNNSNNNNNRIGEEVVFISAMSPVTMPTPDTLHGLHIAATHDHITHTTTHNNNNNNDNDYIDSDVLHSPLYTAPRNHNNNHHNNYSKKTIARQLF